MYQYNDMSLNYLCYNIDTESERARPNKNEGGEKIKQQRKCFLGF